MPADTARRTRGRVVAVGIAIGVIMLAASVTLGPQINLFGGGSQAAATSAPGPAKGTAPATKPSPSPSGRYIVITAFLARGSGVKPADRHVELGVTGTNNFPFNQEVATTTETTYKGVPGWSWTSQPIVLSRYDTFITVGVHAANSRMRVGVWVQVSGRQGLIEGHFQLLATAAIVDLR